MKHSQTAKILLTAFALAVLMALPALSVADTIDQNQPNGSSHMANFSQSGLAQSFMQTNDIISGAGILLQSGRGSSDTVTIQLWDALPNGGGTMLAQASATGTAGQWVDVFWPAVNITPMTTYYLVFTGNTSLGIAGDTANPYPYGQVFANAGYGSFPNYDYAFRTYYDACEMFIKYNEIRAEKLTKDRKWVFFITGGEDFDLFGQIDLGPITWDKVKFSRKKNMLQIKATVPAGLAPGAYPVSVGECSGEIIVTGNDI